ncbi:MAG: pitrilysin family protein [Sneathiellaceae bacterium]
MTVRVSELPSGLKVVTDSMPDIASAAVGVWVDAGSRHEDPSENGVAHFLEHMAFKGTESRSARQIMEEIEMVGGSLNAFTAREQTTYHAQVLEADLPLAVDLLSDIVLRPVFAPEEMERERQVILQEIGLVQDTPDDLVFDHLQAVAYPEQAIGRSILGTDKGIAALPMPVLKGFRDRHYDAGRMIVAAAGAVDHDRFLDMVAEQFQLRPGSNGGGGAARYEAAAYCGGDLRDGRDLDQVHLSFAFPGVSFDDPDYYALQVYATLLGGGSSSRLMQEIREERGLAYSIFAQPVAYADGGLLTLYAGTSDDLAVTLLDVLGEQVRGSVENVTDAEIQRARAQLKAGLLMSLESSNARMEIAARHLYLFGRPLTVQELSASIDAVDREGVVRAARRVFESGRLSFAAVGPVDSLPDAAAIRERFAL